jgi:hypothetical protein
MTELPAPAPPESPGAKKASRESCATPISPDSDNSSEKVDARTPGSPAESRQLDIVFDDGERISMPESRVETEQPMPLPINTPTAAAKKLLRKLSGRRPRKRARRSTPVATHGRSTRTRRGPAKSYAQSDSDSDDVAERPRPPRSPGPLPKDSTCCICLDLVLRRRDAIIFECDHFVCKSCSSDLARHTAEAGAVSTRRGVSVACPLCRRRAKLEISN